MDATRLSLASTFPSAITLDDSETLRGLRFEESASRKLTRAAAAGDRAAFLNLLRKRLEKAGFKPLRKGWPAELEDLVSEAESVATRSTITNGRFELSDRERRNGRRGSTSSPRPASLGDWLEQRASAGPLSSDDLLLLLELLVRDASRASDEQLWKAWRLALQSTASLAEDATAAASPPDAKLRVPGELLWKAGLLFAGLEGSEGLRRQGREALREELLARTDADGLPHAETLPRLDRWLAALVRSGEWSERFGVRLWKGDSKDRLHAVARAAAALLGRDGTAPMVDRRADLRPVVDRLLNQSEWKADARPRHALARGVEAMESPASPRLRRKPPAFQSDAARVALLRSHWTAASDAIVLSHAETPVRIAVRPGGVSLLEGAWDLSVRIDGEPRAVEGEWTCCCWYSDEDADYAELQKTIADGVSVERQVLLSRKDRFAVLVDCVSGAAGRRIDVVTRLPLAPGIVGETDIPTRECRLRMPDARVRVFPLALPDDRVQSAAGSLTHSNSALELAQSGVGGLTVPLVFDWNPLRRRAPADWRTLTVTEQGQVVGRETACGHRLRLGDHQLLIYRSFAKAEQPRAVLGHHTLNETVIGRFDKSGEVHPILMVE